MSAYAAHNIYPSSTNIQSAKEKKDNFRTSGSTSRNSAKTLRRNLQSLLCSDPNPNQHHPESNTPSFTPYKQNLKIQSPQPQVLQPKTTPSGMPNFPYPNPATRSPNPMHSISIHHVDTATLSNPCTQLALTGRRAVIAGK
ncbi:hypothetical protein BO71DRAFT_395847 [Aspergillus ellipticus CBS 707.79]|uniref:Uncharacterized protein n=1 Tax=Aspergillus ellipticus CBS 707.79 TaxID=1448320 RepID=A0A319F0C5_9EURO|nr:hypothetical protein BO71DRAFT_395847 [Aspergillus ellipticus CBS 707.79]